MADRFHLRAVNMFKKDPQPSLSPGPGSVPATAIFSAGLAIKTLSAIPPVGCSIPATWRDVTKARGSALESSQ